MKNLFLFCLLMIILSANSFSQETGNITEITRVVNVQDIENSVISITNPLDVEVFFSLRFNDRFCLSLGEIVKDIKGSAGDVNDSLFLYAWKFMCDNTYTSAPLTNLDWITSLPIYMNTFGVGLGQMQSVVLMKLWAALGYKTRAWNIEGNIIPEVLNDDKWIMLDPTYKVYYMGADDHIAGVEELLNNPEIVNNPENIVSDDLLIKLRAPKMAKIYGNPNRSMFIPDSAISEVQDTFLLQLPPHSSFVFPGIFTKSNIAVDHNPMPYYANCKLMIPPSWQGSVRNYLVVAEIRGAGMVKVRDRYYKTNSPELQVQLNNREQFLTEIGLAELTDTVEIIYFINPIMSEIKYVNQVELVGQHVEELEVGYYPIKDSYSVVKTLRNQLFFYDQIRVKMIQAELAGNSDCMQSAEVSSKEQLLEKLKKYYTCLYSESKKEYVRGVVKKIDDALNELPEGHSLDKLLYLANKFPLTVLFYDFEFASHDVLLKFLTRITSKK